MSSLPLKITGKCVADDETLFAHMDARLLGVTHKSSRSATSQKMGDRFGGKRAKR
jgi:hypothetical protein